MVLCPGPGRARGTVTGAREARGTVPGGPRGPGRRGVDILLSGGAGG